LISENLPKVVLLGNEVESDALLCTAAHGCQGQTAICYCITCGAQFCVNHQKVNTVITLSQNAVAIALSISWLKKRKFLGFAFGFHSLYIFYRFTMTSTVSLTECWTLMSMQSHLLFTLSQCVNNIKRF